MGLLMLRGLALALFGPSAGEGAASLALLKHTMFVKSFCSWRKSRDDNVMRSLTRAERTTEAEKCSVQHHLAVRLASSFSFWKSGCLDDAN